MVKTKLLRGTTHRFRVEFKDIETEAYVAMASGVTLSFWRDGTQVGTNIDPDYEDVGRYYYDYLIPSTAELDEWQARYEGDTSAGAIRKRAVKTFYVVDSEL